MMRSRLPLIGAVALLLSACYTAPVRPPALEDARLAVAAARADPQVTAFAPEELDDAVATYRRAESMLRSAGDVDEVRRLSYLARQRAAIAQEAARARLAEQTDAAAAREREVEEATRSAQLAEARAEAARRAASEAQAKAAQARAAQNEAIAAQRRAQPPTERSATLERELRDLMATRSDRGAVVTLNDVLFDPGSAMLRPGGHRLVARLAESLRAFPDRTIAIEGFTDNEGDDVDNQELSLRRAGAVRQGFMDAGVDGSRVVVRGYGNAFPVASNDSPQGRQRNRRVEVVISDEGAPIAPRVATISGR